MTHSLTGHVRTIVGSGVTGLPSLGGRCFIWGRVCSAGFGARSGRACVGGSMSGSVTNFKVVAAIRIERVDADRHDRSSFCCGDPSLDRWLRDDASAASTTSGLRVEVASNGNQVVGCYALSSFHVEVGRAIGLSGSRHPPLPAILVSRLGVDIRWQRRGLGTSLMVHAIGLANDAAPALNAALLLARAESDPGTAFCTRSASNRSAAGQGGSTVPCGTWRRPSRGQPLGRGVPPLTLGRPCTPTGVLPRGADCTACRGSRPSQ